MTSDRSYRPRYTLRKALDELIFGKGIQFDPELVDVFVKLIQENRDKISEDVHMEFIGRKDDEV